MSVESVFIFGASGHGRVVLDVMEQQGVGQVEGFFDDDPRLWGKEWAGYPVLGGRDALFANAGKHSKGLVAIGHNRARMAVFRWLKESGFSFVSAVHPRATLSRSARLGEGTVVMAGAVINPEARVGDNVIVNTGATVDHDCVVMDHVHIAPGATLCGNVWVGEGVLVGAGATLLPGVRVHPASIVGAGATVVRDVAPGSVVVGTPARYLERGLS